MHCMIRYLSVFLLLSASHLYSQERMQVSRCYRVTWDAPILNIFIDHDQNKWISTGESLFRALACDLIDKIELQADQISLLQIRDGNYDLTFSRSELIQAAGSMMENGENIRTAHFDSERNELWIGTTYSGVLAFQVDGSLRLSQSFTRRNSKLISDQINTIYIDSSGRLWIRQRAGWKLT